MLILAITYMTSAAVVFFRDLSQIINIMLQVGVWVTPIMWDFNDLGLGGLLANILKLNPVFYIVQGYRDSLINKVAIWEHPGADTLLLGIYPDRICAWNQTV